MRKDKNEALKCFGRAVRTLRKARGLSQEALALEADVNRTYMGGLERGEENVSLLTILKLCAVLKVDAAKILLDARL